ncbi:M61 family metallopeptidase [Daejeonella oryzae]|uniref:M61 family metallopeptidase n=1 Tax=Daejeonella oryzae TaxID=1122943 RepID=UPI000421B6B6|nr:PDZ domain-containing protein [Daejeonella oryzae]
MKKILSLSSIILFFFSFAAVADEPVKYVISFPNAVHHEARISMSISEIPAGKLTVRMSRSSPGRYATHEFGKNVYNVQAANEQGKSLTINQVQGDVYEIPDHNGKLTVSYTIFGNWIDGTYLGIDETHAHMNMPATFMWAQGFEQRPIQLQINDLDKYGWKVATQLKPDTDAKIFTAANLQYFLDSPVELSAFKLSSWKDINTDKNVQTIRLSAHSADDQTVIDGYAKMVERMVTEAKAVFGELPTFDFGTYTFLQDVNTENAGDGMEHRNSTVIVERTDKISGNEEDLLSTFSHEFFHAWNVERIRPKTLEPFNFEHANMSNELWFAEGFTQYYGELILKRAGYRDLDTYCGTLKNLLNGVLNAPGANTFPATQMSRYAVFADAGVAVDQTNQVNIFTSYYIYGATIALALDLRLRSEFNLSLDDYMKAVWVTHGKTEIPYTVSDLQKVLSKLTNTAFADDFFTRYVYGTDKNDYKKLLAKAGLVLRHPMADKASIGMVRLSPVNGKLRVAMNTLKGTAAYEAGLDIGDFLLKIGSDESKSSADLETILAKHKPGEEVEITYEHRKTIKNVKVKLQANNSMEIVPAEKAGLKLTPAMEKFRKSWLSSSLN